MQTLVFDYVHHEKILPIIDAPIDVGIGFAITIKQTLFLTKNNAFHTKNIGFLTNNLWFGIQLSGWTKNNGFLTKSIGFQTKYVI